MTPDKPLHCRPGVRDGLYLVEKDYRDGTSITAGFVVENGKVMTQRCAPILRKKISYWIAVARCVARH